jgi:hypothetical protein
MTQPTKIRTKAQNYTVDRPDVVRSVLTWRPGGSTG